MGLRNTAALLERHILDEYVAELEARPPVIAVVRDLIEVVKANDESFLDHLADSRRPFRDQETEELESQLYFGENYAQTGEVKGLISWAGGHEERFENMTAMPFDRSKRLHRIETVKSEASKLPLVTPRFILVPKMRDIYLRTMGEPGVNALAAFDNTPAVEGQTLEQSGSVAEKIGQILMDRETLVNATAHAESLEDVGTYGGATAISAARRRSRFILKCGFSLSKTLVLEKFKGKSAIDYAKYFGKNYLTIPDNEDRLANYELPKDGIYRIRHNVGKAIAQDRDGKIKRSIGDIAVDLAPSWVPERVKNALKSSPTKPKERKKKGMAFTIAPAGTAAERNPGKDKEGRQKEGPESLRQSAMSPTTANLISKFDHLLITSEWEGQVAVSSIYKLINLKDLNQQQRKEAIVANANKIHRELAEQTANLAQIPVTYELIGEDDKSTARKTMLPVPPAA